MTGCIELDDDDEPTGIFFIYGSFRDTLNFSDYAASKPLLLASRSEVWVCGLSLAGIAVSSPAGSRDICLL